jgi:hypothetical protein
VEASLHPRDPDRPGGEWRVAWTSEQVAGNGVPDGAGTRVLTEWESEEGRLEASPLKQGFAVTLGRFSLGLHVLPDEPDELVRYRRRLAKVQMAQRHPRNGRSLAVHCADR